jgi:hypothetical protein
VRQISDFFATVICIAPQANKEEFVFASDVLTFRIDRFISPPYITTRILTTKGIFSSTRASVVFPLVFSQYYGTFGAID